MNSRVSKTHMSLSENFSLATWEVLGDVLPIHQIKCDTCNDGVLGAPSLDGWASGGWDMELAFEGWRALRSWMACFVFKPPHSNPITEVLRI
jgi:hypothetical protein